MTSKTEDLKHLEELRINALATHGRQQSRNVRWWRYFSKLQAMYERGDLVPAAEVAWRDVVAERQRQKAVEGWSPSHDDEHTDGSLAMAAACYANPLSITIDGFGMILSGAPVETEDEYASTPIGWPDSWDISWWKPTTQRRDLVKAAALILAEIERLDRAALRTDKEGQSDG